MQIKGCYRAMVLVFVVFLIWPVRMGMCDETVIDDSLNGSTVGNLQGGGVFHVDGGWKSTGGKIVYDAGRIITNGYFEAKMREWTAPATGIDKSHPLSGWEDANLYSHNTQTGSFWNWRIGTNYDVFKVLAAYDSLFTRQEARVGTASVINDGNPHTYRIDWNLGEVSFLVDGTVLQSYTFPFFNIRYFTIGKDDQYGITDPAPVISDVRVVDRDVGTGIQGHNTHSLPPDDFRLMVHPNPFNPNTRITIQLTGKAYPQLTVCDLLGRQVRYLLDGSEMLEGQAVVDWDGTNGTGTRLSSGVYIIRLQDGKRIRTQKVIMLR